MKMKFLETAVLCGGLILPGLAKAEEGIVEEHAKVQAAIGLIFAPPSIPVSPQLKLATHGHGNLTSEGEIHGGLGAGIQWKLAEGSLEFKPALHLECHVAKPLSGSCELGYGVEAGFEGMNLGANIHLVFTPEGLEEFQLGGRWRGFTLAPHVHRHEEELEWGVRASGAFKLGETFYIIPTMDLSLEASTLGLNLGFGNHIHTY